MQDFLIMIRQAYFEDDDAAKAAEAEAAAKAAAAAGGEGKQFSQEDVNTMIANTKREQSKKFEELESELALVQTTKNMSDEDRSKSKKAIDSLRKQLVTKEKLADEETSAKDKEYNAKVTGLTEEKDKWEKAFKNSKINGEIMGAAIANDAYNPEQVIAIIGQKTQIVENLDSEGKLTGEFKTVVTLNDKDKQGEPIEIEVPVDEAVKRLSEMPEYANLFKVNGVPGFGKNTGKGGKIDFAKLAVENPEEYVKLRKDNPLGV